MQGMSLPQGRDAIVAAAAVAAAAVAAAAVVATAAAVAVEILDLQVLTPGACFLGRSTPWPALLR
jgi:hypothetical protein